MTNARPPEDPQLAPERRWPVFIGSLAVAGLLVALPPEWLPGPAWLLFTIVAGLVALSAFTHYGGAIHANRKIGFVLLGVLTAATLWALMALILDLPSHKLPAAELLRSAAALWVTNVLVFALWYWKLDAGGPYERARRGPHRDGAFLFPQMSMDTNRPWRPDYVDYLFLAFNTSTAFSPTDVAPLSRWAKVLMMVQSGIALTTIAILAGRAVNIL